MRLDTESSLIDIAKACETIKGFTADITQDQLVQSALFASAVERQFAIIGEAMSRMRNKDPEVFAQIEDGRRIIAFRNILIHAYEAVDPVLLWGNTQEPLSRLLADVTRLLEARANGGA